MNQQIMFAPLKVLKPHKFLLYIKLSIFSLRTLASRCFQRIKQKRGGSGIGRATCKLLASQGATVVVTDINKRAADETLAGLPGTNHISIKMDVTRKEEVKDVINKIKERYSSPSNIAVNCAGIPLVEPLLELTEESYNNVFNTNVKGTVWVTQEVCRELIAAKKTGSIVNISSITKLGIADAVCYSATKGAVESFSLSAGKEFGPHGIRINSVAPGLVESPMASIVTKELRNLFEQMTPLRRLGNPEEIAELIVFLASSKASYANAGSFTINGGGV